METIGRYKPQPNPSSCFGGNAFGVGNFIPSFAIDLLGNSGQNLSLAESQEGGTVQTKACRREKRYLRNTSKSHGVPSLLGHQ